MMQGLLLIFVTSPCYYAGYVWRFAQSGFHRGQFEASEWLKKGPIQ